MGIQGFFNQIKNYNVPNQIITSSNTKKYDYIFFDFQSLIYNQLNLYSEINYLIYLLNYLFSQILDANRDNIKIKNIFYKLDNTDTDDFKIMKYIIKKYNKFCEKIGFWIDENNNINYLYNDKKSGTQKKARLFNHQDTTFYYIQLNTILEYIKNNINNNLEDALVDSTVNHVLDMITYFMVIKLTSDENKDRYTNIAKKIKDINSSSDKGIFAYFDGIPSMAKISEQLERRITGQIESLIKTNIKNITFGEVSNILDTLIKPEMIKIGNNTSIVNKIYEKICKSNIKCNQINEIGEAEHQIMDYLTQNKDKLQNKNILIISPDADLILLGLIQQSLNNLKIDIFKEEIINENHFEFSFDYNINSDKINSPYKIINYYTDLQKLQENMGLNQYQILDICFIFLILGDDFIPTIPTVSAKSIPYIINCYKDILLINNNFKIVNNIGNKCIFNQHNFIRFIQKLQKQEENFYKETSKNYIMHPKALNSIDQKTEKFSDFFKLDDSHYNYYYLINALNDSIYFQGSEAKSLKNSITIQNLKKKTNKTDYDIKKYYEGCTFVFDLYFNNKINNYQWYYDYDMSPMMFHILENYKENKNIKDLFILPKAESDNYMNIETYKQYADMNKEEILKKIITELKPKSTVLRVDVQEFIPGKPAVIQQPQYEEIINISPDDTDIVVFGYNDEFYLYDYQDKKYSDIYKYIIKENEQNLEYDSITDNKNNFTEITEFLNFNFRYYRKLNMNNDYDHALYDNYMQNELDFEFPQQMGGSLEDDLEKYITYDNIPKLYDCTNKKYFNKCLKIPIKLLPVKDYLKPKEYPITISYPKCPPDQNGGYNYYKKYIKYKNKYLKLKKIYN